MITIISVIILLTNPLTAVDIQSLHGVRQNTTRSIICYKVSLSNKDKCFIKCEITELKFQDVTEELFDLHAPLTVSKGKSNKTFVPDAIQKDDKQFTWLLGGNVGSDRDNEVTEVTYREDLFEGDIVLVNNGDIVLSCNSSINWHWVHCRSGNNSSAPETEKNAIQHNAVRQKTFLWRNGRIPYVFSSLYTNISKLIILEAFKEFRLHTCIRFVPKTESDIDYIDIAPYDGCYSIIGNNGGRQTVSLGDGCLKKGIVIHELMHVIGFFHEQNRADRDLYVDILWENVKPALYEQFDKYSATVIDDLGSPYDYDSVTHYSSTAFSKNGKPTIIPKWASQENLNNRRPRKRLELSSRMSEQLHAIRTTPIVSSASSTSNERAEIEGTRRYKVNLNFTMPTPSPLTKNNATVGLTTAVLSASMPFKD